MVEKISPQLKETIAAAVAAAKKRTSAEIAVVVSPASDAYQAYVMLYGFAAGSIIATGLWWAKTATAFPLLILVQAAAMACFAFLPFLRHLSLVLIPKHVLHHHAARRAHEELLFASRHVAPDRPVVLLYVALAERYAHILHSRAVVPKVPNSIWDGLIKLFTDSVKKPGLDFACRVTVEKMADALAESFPAGAAPKN